jgi:hypothetical protein
MFDVLNWDNDVYLTGCCDDAPIGSRFAESELYTMHIVSHPSSCSHHLSSQKITEPNAHSFEPASQCHQRIQLLHCLLMIRPADHPRFAKPGSSYLPMVHDLVQPSPILQGSAATIPPMGCDLPSHYVFSHHPYKNRPPFKYTIIPMYFCTNLEHKQSLIKPLPPLQIYTMPTKKSKARSITNNGSGTKVPPSTTVPMHKSPPKLLQMSSAAYALAKRPQTKSKVNAPYPPIGHHPSKPTMLLFCNGKSQAARSTSPPHQKNTQNSSS